MTMGGKKFTIDQMFIKEQLNIHSQGVVDVANALVKDAKKALKNIVGSNAFMEKEHRMCVNEGKSSNHDIPQQ